MVPVLFHIGGVAIPTHEVFVAAGVALACLLFWVEVRRRPREDGRALWTVAGGALAGGAILAKASTAWRLATVVGDVTLWDVLAHGGKSLVGGLAGAYGGALVMKRLIGYRASTGDAFAPGVVAGIAVGRIGCFLTEQIGAPTSLSWGIVPPPGVAARIPNCPQCLLGVPLHPSFLYEIVFLLGLFAVLRRLRGRIPVQGELFKIFLAAYAVFRFFVEFVRGNPVMALGMTGTQLFLALTLPILAAYFVRQVRRGAYRPMPARPAVGVRA